MRAMACGALAVLLLLTPTAQASTANVKLVSHVPGSATSSGDASSIVESVSPNGRFAVLASGSTNLVNGFTDNNGLDEDIFLFDRKTGKITLVSHTPGHPTTGAAGASRDGVVSADGRFVAFDSDAPDLINGLSDGNSGSEDTYVWERATGIVTLVSHTPGNPTASGNDFANDPLISANGALITFTSDATDLVSGFTNNNSGADNSYLYNRASGIVTLVSHAAGDPTAGADGTAFPTQMSQNGRFVAMRSDATNLVSGFTTGNGGLQNAYVADTTLGTIALASHAATGPTDGMDGTIGHLAMSPDGSTVAFSSSGTNLVTGYIDSNPGSDVYAFDRASGHVRLVSHTPGSTTAGTDGTSGGYIELSNGGNFIVFDSQGTTLVPNFTDNNGGSSGDLYLFKKSTGKVVLVTHAAGSASSGGDFAVYTPAISFDGRVIVFDSPSTNLINGFVKNDLSNADVLSYTRKGARVALVAHIPGHPKATGDVQSDVPFVSGDGHSIYFSSVDDDLVNGFVVNGTGDRDAFLLRR